ncbi:MAG: adenylyltransferase/cytidyltransferase family protein [Opitutaceae bacterium]|jgi:cytidyltransferase-like protein
MMTKVIVSSAFDQLNSGAFRVLQEASKLGELHVLLWSDQAIRTLTGREPKFSQAERAYVIQSVRYVAKLQSLGANVDPYTPPDLAAIKPDVWVVDEQNATPARRAFCAAHGLDYRILTSRDMAGFPEPPPEPPSGRKKVVVTGCYDLFHSGHVRFFEEVSELGDLFVVVGHDENVRLLKGAGHPFFTAAERRYVAGSIRYVKQALVSSGLGWMDAEPEIAKIKPDMYAVNEDGDKPEKREFCRERGIQYIVLKRLPKEGLPARTSTDLRGF